MTDLSEEALEDTYLSLYDTALDVSEFAEGSANRRNDIDSGAWALAAITALMSTVAGGFLSKFGEDLADGTKAAIRQLVSAKKPRSNRENIQVLGALRRAQREIAARGRSETSRAETESALHEALGSMGLSGRRLEQLVDAVLAALWEK
jgi:hypothetical protein